MKNQKKKATARAMAAAALLTSLFTVTPIGTHQVQAATDTTPPHLESILSSGDTITLTYDEELTLPNNPDLPLDLPPDLPPGPPALSPPTYTVHTSSGDITATASGMPEGNTMTLTLPGPITNPDPITNPPTIQYSGDIRVSDLAGNRDTSLDTEPGKIIDNSHDTTPPQLVRSIINTDDIQLFYNEPLNPDEIDPADYKITINNGEPQAVSYAEIRGGMVRLMPTRGAIVFGDKVDLTYEAAKATHPLQDKSGNKARDISLSAQATDLIPPKVMMEGTLVSENEVTIRMSEPIKLNSPGDSLAGAFILHANSRDIGVIGCRISGDNLDELILVLDDYIDYGEPSPQLDYIGGNRIVDLAGNPLLPFSGEPAYNHTNQLESIEIMNAPVTLPVGRKYHLSVRTLYSSIYHPPQTTIAPVASYTSTNPDYATADKGVITAIAEGQTTITASYRGKTANIPVTVISEADYKKGIRDRLDPTHTGITLGTIIKFLRTTPLEDFNMDDVINNDDVTYLMQLVSPKKPT